MCRQWLGVRALIDEHYGNTDAHPQRPSESMCREGRIFTTGTITVKNRGSREQTAAVYQMKCRKWKVINKITSR